VVGLGVDQIPDGVNCGEVALLVQGLMDKGREALLHLGESSSQRAGNFLAQEQAESGWRTEEGGFVRILGIYLSIHRRGCQSWRREKSGGQNWGT
jgi:hypothetical protein